MGVGVWAKQRAVQISACKPPIRGPNCLSWRQAGSECIPFAAFCGRRATEKVFEFVLFLERLTPSTLTILHGPLCSGEYVVPTH